MAFNKQRIIIISVLFSLTACTGGGSDDPNPTPQPPLAENDLFILAQLSKVEQQKAILK